MKLLLVPASAVILMGLVGSPASSTTAPTPLLYSVTPMTLSDSQDSPNAVACTSSGMCVAITYGGEVFQLSGSNDEPVTSTGDSVTAVSCPTNSFCAAVGGNSNALVLRPRGISTFNVDYPAFYSAVHWESISCPSTSFCMAGGGIIQGDHSGAGVVALWDGHQWSVAKVVDPFLASDTHTFISSMSCVTRRFCMAADGNNRALQWNGVRWTFPRALNAPKVTDSFVISCTSTTFCLALGQTPTDVFSWNGHTWRQRLPSPFDPGNYVDLSCVTTTFCVAVDDDGNASLWNGTIWGPAQAVDPNNYFNAISCSSAWVCAAVGSNDDFVYLHSPLKTPHVPPLCTIFHCEGTKS